MKTKFIIVFAVIALSMITVIVVLSLRQKEVSADKVKGTMSAQYTPSINDLGTVTWASGPSQGVECEQCTVCFDNGPQGNNVDCMGVEFWQPMAGGRVKCVSINGSVYTVGPL